MVLCVQSASLTHSFDTRRSGLPSPFKSPTSMLRANLPPEPKLGGMKKIGLVMAPPAKGLTPEAEERSRGLAPCGVDFTSRPCHQPLGSRIRSQMVLGRCVPWRPGVIPGTFLLGRAMAAARDCTTGETRTRTSRTGIDWTRQVAAKV